MHEVEIDDEDKELKKIGMELMFLTPEKILIFLRDYRR